MSQLAFFDTNVILYCDDASDPTKRERALDLLYEHQAASRVVISIQVLQEYFAAATRKLKVPAPLAQQKVENLAREKVVRFAEADVIAAIELHRLTSISFWDSMIVHAARIGGARLLYSEDMQDGSVIGGMLIENPFR
jgi:predicted nucleic acid-binding protein